MAYLCWDIDTSIFGICSLTTLPSLYGDFMRQPWTPRGRPFGARINSLSLQATSRGGLVPTWLGTGPRSSTDRTRISSILDSSSILLGGTARQQHARVLGSCVLSPFIRVWSRSKVNSPTLGEFPSIASRSEAIHHNTKDPSEGVPVWHEPFARVLSVYAGGTIRPLNVRRP